MDLKLFAEAYQSVQEKKLDPVGKEDGDVDNDGDKDSSDSYLMKRRAAIKKAMKKEEVEKEETAVSEHHQKDADGKVIEHEDEAPGTPSSVEEQTVLEQLAENGKGIDKFEAVVSYLIDEGLSKTWEEAQKIMGTLKSELVEEIYQNQLWTLFDENYRAMRNPKEDKPESEMSYDEKRKKRMNDPKKGINSPAFKKFMASQGM